LIAAFTDMHVRSDVGLVWPAGCLQNQQNLNNEIAFTFLFFDLFSCVQDDAKLPIMPPTK
jgi:hypothetical protein